MINNGYRLIYTFTCLFILLSSQSSIAASHVVDCPTHSLQTAIDTAVPGDSIIVSGVCEEQITITTNDLTLIGNSTGSNAEISGANLPFPTLVKIISAVRVSFTGFNLNSGLSGVDADAGASFKMADSNISDMTIGINLKNNSNAKLQNISIENSEAIGLLSSSGSTTEVIDTVSITNSGSFGMNITDGAEMKVTESAILTLSGNFFGAQISTGAVLFSASNSSIIADNNVLIGISINIAATMLMFNSDASASGNGLDGLDVVSSANLDIDGDSTLIVNNNRREGISLDNGSLNTFGFFSSKPNLPRIVANNNTNNGIQIEFGSKLDIGRNGSLEANDNGLAGISLDDGSSANIHDSVITGNNGVLVKKTDDDGIPTKTKGPADIVATFASRISFRGNNDVGRALCDKSSITRGDVKCKD